MMYYIEHFVRNSIIGAGVGYMHYRTPSKETMKAYIREDLNSDNDLEVESIKADKKTGTFIVYINQNKTIDRLYDGYPGDFKRAQRTLLKLSKQFKGKTKDGIDYSYIQVIKPNHSDTILLSVSDGKVKYSAIDDIY